MKRFTRVLAAVLLPGLLVAALLFGLALMQAAPSAVAQTPDGVPAFVVLQASAVTNTNGTAVAPISVADAYGQLTVYASGMVSGTIHWEGTINDVNWVALLATNVSSGAAAITTTAAGAYRLDVSGLSQVRARVSGVVTNTTDTVNVAGWLTAP